jgi:hypothetical protein
MFCQCLLYVCQNLRIKRSIGSVNVFSMYVRTLESEDIDRTYRALDSKVLTCIEKTLTEPIELLILRF